MKPTCPICMQPYVNQTFLQPCYHSFCFTCARQWINISPTCPICKRDIQSLIYDVCEETNSFHEYVLACGRHGRHNPPPKRRPPTLQERARMFRARIYETEFASIIYPPPLGRFANMDRIEPIHIAKVREFIERELPVLMHSDRDTDLEQHVIDILQKSKEQYDPAVIRQLAEWLALGHNNTDPTFLAKRFLEELYAFLKSGQQYWTFISKAQYQEQAPSDEESQHHYNS